MSYQDLTKETARLAPNLTVDQKIRLARLLLHDIPHTIWERNDIVSVLAAREEPLPDGWTIEDLVRTVTDMPGWRDLGFREEEDWAKLEDLIASAEDAYGEE